MLRTRDFTGERFGRLTVESHVGRGRWRCRCDCGGVHVGAFSAHLRNGLIKSCGCLAREMAAAKNYRHGGCKSPEYAIWATARARCRNPNNQHYKDYGGRGIQMCEEWAGDFAAFIRDVGPRPSALHSIDRIDNNGNYQPGNVRWAAPIAQANNKRCSRLISFRGETHSLSEWSRLLNKPYDRLKARLRRHGWSVERALTE